MLLWESEQAFQNAWEAVEPVGHEIATAFGAMDEPKVEGYEVSYGPQTMRRAA